MKQKDLKNRLKGGLDELLQPTISEESENNSENLPQQKKKDKLARSNFLIEKSYHTRLKKIAADKEITMITAIKEALDLYFSTTNKP